jgi:hypothetical protein
VSYYVASAATPANGVHGSVSLDANGRYVIPNLPNGHRVKLGAYVPVVLGQTCAAHATMDTDTVMAALRTGCRRLAFSGTAALSQRLADMAAQLGAWDRHELQAPDLLRLSPDDDARTRCRAWLLDHKG